MRRAQAPRDQVQRLSNINLVLLVTLLVAFLFHSKVLPLILPPNPWGPANQNLDFLIYAHSRPFMVRSE